MEDKYPFALQGGTEVGGQYLISRVIGNGGCGITYLALDKINRAPVALKECFSEEFCIRGDDRKEVINYKEQEEFENIRNRFREEAQLLQQCKGIMGAMPIFRVLEENGTCYYAMEYLEGQTLKEYLKEHNDILTVK